MEFSDLIDRRQSIRAYEKSALDESTIGKILQIARMAPSAGDLQSYRIVVVLSPTARGALSDAAGQYYITQAALVLVFFADVERSAAKYYDRGRNLFSLQDATIAAAYAQLAAADLGLGSCWVGDFQRRKNPPRCQGTERTQAGGNPDDRQSRRRTREAVPPKDGRTDGPRSI